MPKDNPSTKENFINWMADVCQKNQNTFCGITEAVYINRYEYIGFSIVEDLGRKDRYRSFTINAFYKDIGGTPLKIYVMFFDLVFDDEDKSSQHILLHDHYITQHKGSGFYRIGIGTAGMGILKSIAYEYNCSKIVGRRKPVNDTPEEQEKLWDFYDKNGFTQWKDKNYIEYDMSNYKPE